MLFAGMDIESVILTKLSETERRNISNISYMWNLKRNDTNELTYKTERDSQS